MNKKRNVPIARQLEELKNLQTRRTRCVSDAQAEAETTVFEPQIHQLFQSGALFFACVLVLKIRKRQ